MLVLIKFLQHCFCTVFISQQCLNSDITWAPTGNVNTILLMCIWPKAACGYCLWQQLWQITIQIHRAPFIHVMFSIILFLLCYFTPTTCCPHISNEKFMKDTKTTEDSPHELFSPRWESIVGHGRIINHTTKYRWRGCFVAQVCLISWRQYMKVTSDLQKKITVSLITALKSM